MSNKNKNFSSVVGIPQYTVGERLCFLDLAEECQCVR